MKSIPVSLKARCVAAKAAGMPKGEIYDKIYAPSLANPMSSRSFKRELNRWDQCGDTDIELLRHGTFPIATPHGATVQINGKGEVTQAWIKQTIDDGRFSELLDAIKTATEPVRIEPRAHVGEGMLEIPLFDQHFPLSDHKMVCSEILALIMRQEWAEINVIVGQDLFHNDDFRGRTASGRPIEKVDMAAAWRMAREFWNAILEASLERANRVRLTYSPGNHDESLAWAFVQMLRERYPQITVDDSSDQRKVIYWRECFIGITHGSVARSAPSDLRGQFTIEHPVEFSNATVREIHAGHLHHEKECDIYGVMVRRLSRSGNVDQWTKDQGFVGSHSRFMVFEWLPGRLKSIHYIGG